MNELRVKDLFDMDPLENSLRNLLRPWRLEGVDRAPQIKIDLSEHDDSYMVKADIPGVRKEDIDDTRADAKYQNGVLELRLPKKATGSSRKLSVG